MIRSNNSKLQSEPPLFYSDGCHPDIYIDPTYRMECPVSNLWWPQSNIIAEIVIKGGQVLITMKFIGTTLSTHGQ